MIRVLIVDDSPLVRRMLRELLTSDSSIEVVAEAGDGQEAIAKVSMHRPDVVTMDVRMPNLDGLSATEHIMAFTPTPILVITALNKDLDIGFQMLKAGALEVFEKPANLNGPGQERIRRELIERVKVLSRVRTVTHLQGRRARLFSPMMPAQEADKRQHPVDPVVVIGASTGGPKALQTILSALPKDLRAPVVLVQHIAEGFMKGMVEWLASTCQINVTLARAGQYLQRSEVIVVPDGLHMRLNEERRVILSDLPKTVQRPSVDITMQSVAESYGRNVIGVLLTGMGRDGALGMEAIKKAGGFTIAQDEASSAIFGMPKAAIERGAADQVLPVEQIAPALLLKLAQRALYD
jgi:two-component system, chemotaxis family, protein-glutamate methylesterase/glutaminase